MVDSTPESLSSVDVRIFAKVASLFSKDEFATIIKEFRGSTSPGIASAVSSSLMRLGQTEDLMKYLSSVKQTPEMLLKAKTIGYAKTMAQMEMAKEPRVHLLLLSYNRDAYVENALRQLAATRYSNYAVYILDNHSTDGSWAIVSKARDIFPPSVDVHVERMPTNIGRPAGHNWLLTNHDHSEADYIAIGDDDLLDVPPTWLRDMVRTMRLFPDAAIVGGKALNQGRPRIIHGGVRKFITFGPDEMTLTNDKNSQDFGQFDYIDRVDHVIGCLHLYRREAFLNDVGLFDIRFSPCQFVDIEHHLRTRMKGYAIIYNGLIEFRHLRGMGQEAAASRSMGGNSYGNRVKVLCKYNQKHVMDFLQAERTAYQNWMNHEDANQF